MCVQAFVQESKKKKEFSNKKEKETVSKREIILVRNNQGSFKFNF